MRPFVINLNKSVVKFFIVWALFYLFSILFICTTRIVFPSSFILWVGFLVAVVYLLIKLFKIMANNWAQGKIIKVLITGFVGIPAFALLLFWTVLISSVVQLCIVRKSSEYKLRYFINHSQLRDAGYEVMRRKEYVLLAGDDHRLPAAIRDIHPLRVYISKDRVLVVIVKSGRHVHLAVQVNAVEPKKPVEYLRYIKVSDGLWLLSGMLYEDDLL